MGKTLAACVVVVLVALSACGKSRRADPDRGHAGEAGEPAGGTSAAAGGNAGETAGGNAGVATGGSADAGSGASGGSGGVRSTECIVVRRVACCAQPFAVSREAFEADECLLPFDQNLTDGELLSRCETTRPADCGPENCVPRPPPSRSAVPDADGDCQFVDECTGDDDCTFASQCCSCCACLQPMPKSRARAETCIVSEDSAAETEPRPPACVVCPGGNLCQGCRHERTLSCSPTPQGLRICQWGPTLPADKCSAERDCGGDSPSDLQCYAPDFNCGGPAPPPDECAIDSDCADAGADRICSRTGYCNMAVCIPGCTSNDDCTVAEVCSSTRHCVPKPCTERAECGANFECSPDGVCVRADCASTTACEGFCVNGLCYDEPGSCSVPPV